MSKEEAFDIIKEYAEQGFSDCLRYKIYEYEVEESKNEFLEALKKLAPKNITVTLEIE